ncbi:unnamed protein product, partial [Allacma fusca]
PHQRKKNLGWVKAQVVRRENMKRKKLMEETATAAKSNALQNSDDTDFCTNSLEELSSNDISMQPEDPLIAEENT